jgi:hypothetical protein
VLIRAGDGISIRFLATIRAGGRAAFLTARNKAEGSSRFRYAAGLSKRREFVSP